MKYLELKYIIRDIQSTEIHQNTDYDFIEDHENFKIKRYLF